VRAIGYSTIVIAVRMSGRCGPMQISTATGRAVQSCSSPPGSSTTSGIAIHDGHTARLAEIDVGLNRTVDCPTDSHRATPPKYAVPKTASITGKRINGGRRSRSRSAILRPGQAAVLSVDAYPAFRPEGTAFFNLSRLYLSSIGIALVFFFYDNTQAMHIALAKDLMPYRAAAHVGGSVARPELATLNDMVTGQAAFVGIIDPFKVIMIAMLIVSPLVLFLSKPRPANQQG
jgi:hypothetical protein